MKNKIIIPRLSFLSYIILAVGLPLMIFVFSYILLMLIHTPENEKSLILLEAVPMLEYAFMSFTIVVCGALFTDIVIKSYK